MTSSSIWSRLTPFTLITVRLPAILSAAQFSKLSKRVEARNLTEKND
jgi:hypothetical protein